MSSVHWDQQPTFMSTVALWEYANSYPGKVCAVLIAPDATLRGLGPALLNSIDQSPLRVRGISVVPRLTPNEVGRLYNWQLNRLSPWMSLKASHFGFGYAVAALVEHENAAVDPHPHVVELKGPHTPRRADQSTIRGRFKSSNAFFNLMHTSEPSSVLADLGVYAKAAATQPYSAEQISPLSDCSFSMPISFGEILGVVRSRLCVDGVSPATRPTEPEAWSIKSVLRILRQLDDDDLGYMPNAEARSLWSALQRWRRYDADLLPTIEGLLNSASVHLTPWEELLLLTSIGSIAALTRRWH